MALFINRRGQGYTETVSQPDNRREARGEISAYRVSDPNGTYWISPRACSNWKQDSAHNADQTWNQSEGQGA